MHHMISVFPTKSYYDLHEIFVGCWRQSKLCFYEFGLLFPLFYCLYLGETQTFEFDDIC